MKNPQCTVQRLNHCPLDGTWGSLTLDIAIYIYLITPFSFLFLYLHYRFSAGDGPAGRSRGRRPQRIATVTAGHKGIYSLINFEYMPKTTRALVGSTGGSTVYFLEGLKANWRQGGGMATCFT